MKNKWIYDKVNKLIKKYKTRNPEELIRELNIHIQSLYDTKSLLGMYKVILRNRFIFISDNVGDLRNTILAHELGHDQLHRKECVKGANFHENKVFNPTNIYEIEANIFAAHLLIPDEDIINMIKYSESYRDLANELNVDINLLNLKISEMAKMNLLDIDNSKVKIPESEFLKFYKPSDDDWHIC